MQLRHLPHPRILIAALATGAVGAAVMVASPSAEEIPEPPAAVEEAESVPEQPQAPPETSLFDSSTQVPEPAVEAAVDGQPEGSVDGDTTMSVNVQVGGTERSYLLSLPTGNPGERGWPVIFAFHGWLESAELMSQKRGLSEANAFVVSGRGTENAWEGGPYARTNSGEQDQAYVHAILDQLRESQLVDDSRIYAAGMSNGGGFAAKLGCRMPDTFAAVASVAGAYYDDTVSSCVDAPVPFLEIHGTDDKVIGYNGGERHGTHYEPVADVLDLYAGRNKCVSDPQPETLSASVSRLQWRSCGDGHSPTLQDSEAAVVEHYRIDGGGHIWPSGEVDATRLVLEFFDEHMK